MAAGRKGQQVQGSIKTDQGAGRTVRRRRVFYIPGYDPVHPRRYRELYRSEGTQQAKISGYSIDLKGKKGSGPFGWSVESEIDGSRVQADFAVLVWSDIVRGSMDRGILFTYWLMLRTVAVYIGSGAFFQLLRLRKGPIIAALYPIGMLILQAVLALGAGWGLFLLGRILIPGMTGLVMGACAGAAVIWGLTRWFRRIDGRTFVYYLMHDYAYSAGHLGATPENLGARIDSFADQIANGLDEEGVDEVLVVGHSSGAHIAVSALARLLRHGGEPAGARLSLLTLGQVVPMVSFLPKASELRGDLQFMSEQTAIPWVDVTAPGDGCTFALCDPVAVSGVARSGRQAWPLVISAAFTQSLSPEKWQALKRRYFRLHFQYLCAFDRPADYDYFQITAGPVTLGARYRDRAPSPSRIAVARSPYRSIST